MQNLRGVVTLAALACALVAPVAACADVLSSDNSTGIGIQASSLGYGVSLSRSIAPRVDLRLQTGTLDYTHNGNEDNLNYTGTVRLRNTSALIDVRPTNSAFHLSAGLVFGGDRIDVTGVPDASGNFTIGGHTYSGAQIGTVVGTAQLNSGAPYLGIGLGAPRRRVGIAFTSDIGVVFHNVSTSMTGYGPAAGTAQFQADLAQAQSDFQNGVGFLKTYPVVSIGLATRF